MDLLADYGDDADNGESGLNSDSGGQEYGPGLSVPYKSLQAEWESFEKLITSDSPPQQPVVAATVLPDVATVNKELDEPLPSGSHSDKASSCRSSHSSRSTSVDSDRSSGSKKGSQTASNEAVQSPKLRVSRSLSKSRSTDREKRSQKYRSPSRSESRSKSRSRSKTPKRRKRKHSRRSRSRSRRQSRSRTPKRHKHSRSPHRHRRHRDRLPYSRKKYQSKHKSRSRERRRSKDRFGRTIRDKNHKSKRSSSRGKRSKSRSRTPTRSRRSRSRSVRHSRSRSVEHSRRSRSRSLHSRRSRSLSKSPVHSRHSRSHSRGRDRPRRDSRRSSGRSKGKPLNFKEQMRQQLIKASKLLSEQAQAGTLSDLGDQKELESPKERPSNLPLNESTIFSSLVSQTCAATVTPQVALLHTMAAMHQKAQEMTGIAVPKYYNPAAVNPLKYAEQVQKRKLLWTKHEGSESQWQGTAFSTDQDGKMAAKFRKLMGIKPEDEESQSINIDEQKRKQEELFSRLDKEYEFARMATHTHRGVGLGFQSQSSYQH